MKMSLVTPIPWTTGTTYTQVYREAIEQVRYAEELGFDCVWFTEHHFATHGINPSVFSFIGYVAGVTKRIHLGTAVAVVPLYHPLRLAEDVATVDIVSNGRLELGIGSGYRQDEFKGFRVAQEESRAMLLEGVEILQRAWTGGPFGYHGKYHIVPEGTVVRPTPLQKPHPPIWVAGVSPQTLEWVARQGYRWMGATTTASFAQLGRLRTHFDQALLKAGRTPADGESYVHFPIFISDKPQADIKRELEPALTWLAKAVSTGGTIYQQRASSTQGPSIPLQQFNFDAYQEHSAVVGDVDFCLEKITACWKQLRFAHMTCAFGLGLPHTATMKNMEKFARYLMPSLRNLETKLQ
ncbi:MAG: LLM class flavin-dependent oxidoreductase [Deltaproteobacteria bacterium]|nr:LLM class flavin-dependent oxidoreductase [Deltaproteobacteria bacterium]